MKKLIYIPSCPNCKRDISDMSHLDAVGEIDLGGELGKSDLFICPGCGRTFTDITIEYVKEEI